MHDVILTIILVLPSVLIAARSVAGRNAGLFILYIWLAAACTASFFGFIYCIFAIMAFVSIAFAFRRNLELQKWISRKSEKNPN